MDKITCPKFLSTDLYRYGKENILAYKSLCVSAVKLNFSLIGLISLKQILLIMAIALFAVQIYTYVDIKKFYPNTLLKKTRM